MNYQFQNYQHQLEQHQLQQPYQEQITQQEIKQKVQQDFLNIIGIAQDVQDALNYFQQDQNNEMVKIQYNRLILQLNISSGIHSDLSRTFQISTRKGQFLNQIKCYSKYLLKEQIQRFDPHIQYYLSKYQSNCLQEYPVLGQEPLKQVDTKGEFNLQVVNKIFAGIQKQDQITQEIQQGKKFDDITTDYVNNYLNKRSKESYKKLRKNFEGMDSDCDLCQLI